MSDGGILVTTTVFLGKFKRISGFFVKKKAMC